MGINIKMGINLKMQQVQERIQTISKSGHNNFNNYSYVTLGDMLVPLRPILAELKLIIIQSTALTELKVEQINNKFYTMASVNCITLVTDAETGEHMEISTPGFASDANGDKCVFKAVTGARKYGIASMFALEWFSVEPEDDRFDMKAPSSNEMYEETRTPSARKRRSL